MAERNQVAAELREIAATLQAMVEGGAFDLCFTDARADMATLPDKLAALADEIEAGDRRHPMPYPDDFSSAVFDAAQGVDDDDAPPEGCYEAAAAFLYALDRGWLTISNPDSLYIAALRQTVAAEAEARAADAAALRAASARLRALAAEREGA